MEFTKSQIEEYFLEIRDYLLKVENRYSLPELRSKLQKSTGAGVYCIFNNGQLCYVGETGSLFGRFSDFGRTVNHTFRRSLGGLLFSDHPNFYKASSTKKFDTEIEKKLDEYVKENIQISIKPIFIGRKEFEDWMQEYDITIELLNKRKKRI